MSFAIGFPDFKKFAEEYNKRIYYFQAGKILNLFLFSDGLVFKSFVNLDSIPDKEIFFGDKVFIGATQLLEAPMDGGESRRLIHESIPSIKIVDKYMPKETKNVDIQREGVGKKRPGA